MNPPNPLQPLYGLDRTSLQFHEQLSNFLRGGEYQNGVLSLKSEDLAQLIEYLDSVLISISDHATFQECLHELRKLCGIEKMLPKSCMLSDILSDVGLPSTSGHVYEGTLRGSKVRIQRVRIYSKARSEKVQETFYQVAVMRKHLAHPNIVPLLGVTLDPLQLISDWSSGENDLTEHIMNNPDADRLRLLSDVAEGLNYLHSCNVIHGGLKGVQSSVLVDTSGRARITDFGLASVTHDLYLIWNPSDEHRHGARWIAPEILDDRGTYTKEADVFSFAMVMIETFTGAVPFSDKPPHAAMLAMMDGERPPRPTDPTFTDELWTLAQHCWDKGPTLRPRASEVLRTIHSFGPPMWKRLISYPLAACEQIPLVMAIFSDKNETEVVQSLCGNDGQAFVDVIDEMLDTLVPWLRRKCLSTLRRICGRQALLPRSVQIPFCYDRLETPLYRGGFADVWKGEHHGCHVAVKVLRVYARDDFVKVASRFCKEVVTWKRLRHPNVLPLLGVTMGNHQFAMASEWMENGNINEFTKVHRDANRFELLEEVARGLIYIHGEGMIHGDLKGANILIDQNGHVRLADFGLLTIVSDSTYPTTSSSNANAGTTRWMSPELIDPDQFGFQNCRRTKESDCYALGMVVLEVLTGQAPFPRYTGLTVMKRVVDGERPGRPQGARAAWFTDSLWETLEQCWSPRPKDRPTVGAVLGCLERVSTAWQPLPPDADDDTHTSTDDESHSTVSHLSSQTIPQGGDESSVLSHSHPSGAVGPAVTYGGEALLHQADHLSNDIHQEADPATIAAPEAEDNARPSREHKGQEKDPQSSVADTDKAGPVDSGKFLQPSEAYKVHGDYYPSGMSPGHYSTTRQYQGVDGLAYHNHVQGAVPVPYTSGNSTRDVYPQPGVNTQWTLAYQNIGTDSHRSASWPQHAGHLVPQLFPSGYTPVIQIQVPGGSRERREVIVPQRSYIPYHRQNYFDQFTPENPITFSNRSGQEGIALTDVMNEYFDHLLGRDDPMFPNYKGPTISLRLEWPGYKSWLKQISTRDWRREPKPITKAKLAIEVAKKVQSCILDTINEPITPGSERWKVGPGFIEIKDLVLVRLVHVSKGSWQPEFRAIEHFDVPRL